MTDSLEDRQGIEPESEGEPLPSPVVDGIPGGARRVALLAVLLIVPAAVGGWSVGGAATAIGVVGGGAVAVVNFVLLARIVVKTTSGEALALPTMMARLVVKFGLLAGSLGAVVLLLQVDALGVLIGLTVIFGAVILASVVDLLT